jgi:hypothetical protein
MIIYHYTLHPYSLPCPEPAGCTVRRNRWLRHSNHPSVWVSGIVAAALQMLYRCYMHPWAGHGYSGTEAIEAIECDSMQEHELYHTSDSREGLTLVTGHKPQLLNK